MIYNVWCLFMYLLQHVMFCYVCVDQWVQLKMSYRPKSSHAVMVFPLRPYSTPTRRWWRCLLWCTTYEPCQLDTRPSFARGPSLFPSAVTQTIRPAGKPSAMDAPCATSFIWGWLLAKTVIFAVAVMFAPPLLSLIFLFCLPIPNRFQSSKSGKIYLHRDIRLLFSRKSMEVDSGAAYELQSFTESPIDPPFSPRCWGPTPSGLHYRSFSHTSMPAIDSYSAHGELRSNLRTAVNKTHLACAQNLQFHPLCHPELTRAGG